MFRYKFIAEVYYPLYDLQSNDSICYKFVAGYTRIIWTIDKTIYYTKKRFIKDLRRICGEYFHVHHHVLLYANSLIHIPNDGLPWLRSG